MNKIELRIGEKAKEELIKRSKKRYRTEKMLSRYIKESMEIYDELENCYKRFNALFKALVQSENILWDKREFAKLINIHIGNINNIEKLNKILRID